MLNKSIRSAIIVMIQFIVPMTLIFIIASQLLEHTQQLNHARDFLNEHQLQFLLAHCIFYVAIVLIWPLLIKITVSSLNQDADKTQIKTAVSARWYLIAVMAFFELISWWK